MFKRESSFQSAIKGKQVHYDERSFASKISRVFRKLGAKAAYAALLLFEALKGPKLARKDKMIILGALGYLILPVDLLPDFLPVVGLTDDAALIIAAIWRVWRSVDKPMKERARAQARKWFGSSFDADRVERTFKIGE